MCKLKKDELLRDAEKECDVKEQYSYLQYSPKASQAGKKKRKHNEHQRKSGTSTDIVVGNIMTKE